MEVSSPAGPQAATMLATCAGSITFTFTDFAIRFHDNGAPETGSEART